jgi:hypothetical protein
VRCGTGLERCSEGPSGPDWTIVDDCGARGMVCSSADLGCTACAPGATRCNGRQVERCSDDGSGFVGDRTCDDSDGVACRDGICVDLCGLAAQQRSNVGCEYWGADLDNADIDDTLNAAAQQYAIVVSNPQPDLVATVTVEQDDTAPGTPNSPAEVARASVQPLSLRVFKLGPREVDGSPPGTFNSGTNTAVTRASYRIRSNVPVVAYQFNPLENVNVFSNDASLLKPVEALAMGADRVEPAYVVLGWPQTIAITDDPNTNFSSTEPTNLRATLTILGTRPNTHVRVHTKARVVGGGPIPETPAGGVVEYALQPFDVLNLETGDFNADFTGSTIDADEPVVAFSGSEASDAPSFDKIANRQCCADHLEEQLDPIRTAGRQFIATVSPNRTRAIAAAGATSLGVFAAPEYFRVAAVTTAGAVIRTTLDPPRDRVVLNGFGDTAEITSTQDFALSSDNPISLASISPSQAAAGVPRGLPGGDPSLLVIPPIEQFRANYVFLTPDKYAFDFVRIVAPRGAAVTLDGDDVDRLPSCERVAVPSLSGAGAPPDYVVYRCQLSFPVVDPSPSAAVPVAPGLQNDGVHEIVSPKKIGVLVDGFDRNVSYAYAAGTELDEIVPPP